MLIALIRKDDASEIAREVADIEAARALATSDMPVFILEGGVKIPVDEYGREPTTETKVYSDGSSATGPGPLPDRSPEQQDAAAAKAKAAPAKKTAARKR